MPASPYRTFEHDAGSETSAMRLRAAGVIVVMAGVVALAFVLPTWVGLVWGVLGLIASVAWIALIGRARRRLRAHPTLELAPHGLVFDDARSRVELPWTEVTAVSVDEDRLDVRIDRREGDPLRIDVLFRGASVYDLAQAIGDAWRASTGEAGRSSR